MRMPKLKLSGISIMRRMNAYQPNRKPYQPYQPSRINQTGSTYSVYECDVEINVQRSYKFNCIYICLMVSKIIYIS